MKYTSAPATKPVSSIPQANERRGLGSLDPALMFIRTFPVGSALTPEDFDAWAGQHGLLQIPAGTSKQSDTWKAHLQRRHELKHKLILAGTHPRMRSQGATAFTIEAMGPGNWQVRTPESALAQSRTTSQVRSLIETKRKMLRYLMQSADWSILPPYEKMFAETLYRSINSFARRVSQDADDLNETFAELQAKLHRAIAEGIIQPRNSGLQHVLALPEADPAGARDDTPAEA
jgi:hypothetical protein